MKLFERNFIKHLTSEMNVAGAGGVFGTGENGDDSSMNHGGAFPGGADFWNKDNTIIAKGGKKKKKTKKEENVKDGSLQPLIPMQRRTMTPTM